MPEQPFLTSLERRCLGRIAGRKLTRDINNEPSVIEGVSQAVLNRTEARGWWTWKQALAVLTPEGLAELKRPIPDEPRLLVDLSRAHASEAGSASDRDLGYTSTPFLAAALVPEGVDRVTQERFSKEGSQQTIANQHAVALAREQLAVEDRLRLIRREASERGVDISRQERQLLNRLRAMEAKIRSQAA